MAVGALWPQCSGRSPLAPLPSRITRQARPTPSCSHTICALPAPPADACSQTGSVVCSSCPSYMTAHPVKAPIGVRVSLRLLAASDEPGQKKDAVESAAESDAHRPARPHRDFIRGNLRNRSFQGSLRLLSRVAHMTAVCVICARLTVLELNPVSYARTHGDRGTRYGSVNAAERRRTAYERTPRARGVTAHRPHETNT